MRPMRTAFPTRFAQTCDVALAACLLLPGCATPPPASTSPDAQAADAAPQAVAAPSASAPVAAPLDPLDQWRLDDAKDPQLAAPTQKPGLVDARGSAPVDKILAAFGVRAKAVAACARHVAEAPALLRVRVAIDPQGRATWAASDYRIPLPDPTRSCVESVLRSRPYALATPEGLTVTYRFAFSAYGLL